MKEFEDRLFTPSQGRGGKGGEKGWKEDGSTIDWGTIMVYTCTVSCGGGVERGGDGMGVLSKEQSPHNLYH